MQTALSTAASISSTSALQSTRLISRRQISKQGRAPTMRLRFDPSHLTTSDASYLVVPAIEGSHLSIQSFLQRMLHRPSRAEFTSATLRPNYRPQERLLMKHPVDRSLIAHVQLEPQSIRFGRSELPVSRLRDLAVLPEFLTHGVADRMLSAAEAEAKRSGAMLIVTRGVPASNCGPTCSVRANKISTTLSSVSGSITTWRLRCRSVGISSRSPIRVQRRTQHR